MPTSSQNMFFVILSLALGAFAIGTSEFAAMGLLPWYAQDLGVTEPEAGHVISAYAFGVVVGAPLTTLLGARLPRRSYLAALIGAYGVLNLLAALLPGYSNLLLTRFCAGLPHGGFLGVAMLFAADALPAEQRAKGVTQVILGLTVANIIGVPLGQALGQALGWRAGFAFPGALALLSAALIWRLAPRLPADPSANPWAELRALKNPAVILVLLVGTIGSGGVFAVYAYMSAAMLATASPPAWALPLLLSIFGLGMTLGSINAARMTIRFGALRTAGSMLCLLIVAQGFAALVVGNWPLMLLSGLILGFGSSLFVPLQTRLMDVAGEAQSMAAAMNHAAFNAANGLGPLLAGLALNAGWGYRSSGLVAIGLSLGGLVMLALVVAEQRRRVAR